MALFNRIHKAVLLLLKLSKLSSRKKKKNAQKSRWEDQEIKKHIVIDMHE